MKCIALVLAVAGCGSTPPTAGDASRTIVFSTREAGSPPGGFESALTGGGGPPAWFVRAARDAGAAVLVQESSDETSYRFPLCIYEGMSASDVSAEVAFKPISGNVDQAGGVVLRYRPENYYVARANALEDNINLFKTVRGNRLKIAEVPVKVTPNAWHTLTFSARGTHFSVDFDGKRVIDAEDRTFSRPGKVGLWTKADSVTAFASLKIDVSK